MTVLKGIPAARQQLLPVDITIESVMVEHRLASCPTDAPQYHVHMIMTQYGVTTTYYLLPTYTICMAPSNALKLAEQLDHCGGQACAKLVMKALDS
ncbi:MAG: hypothetical protein AAB875_05200 [Patescibacteria group bacterium]